MANEQRLIDANELMVYTRNQKSRTIDCNDIARFPTVDAVEVVRCRDCKHGKKSALYPREPKNYFCTQSWDGGYHEPDFFCSYGERRNHDT